MKHALALAAFSLLSVVASANVQYFTSYRVNLHFGQPVTNIIMLEVGDGFGGATWAFTASGEGETLLNNPFPSQSPVQSSLLIGLVRDLPNDAPGQVHVVLLLDPEAAQLANHIAWGTLFRDTREEDLIAAIELATSGQDWPIVLPALEEVSFFANNNATDGILGPGGVPHSAWFSTGGPFAVMAFSDGTIIGDGVSELIEVPVRCPGDADGNGTVELTDLAMLLGAFGTSEGATFEQGDFDGDGDVDLTDLATLLTSFGSTCP